MITVKKIVTADNPNTLANSDLATAPGPGLYLIWVASSQADTIVSVSAPPLIPSRSISPALRSNGVVLISDDVPDVFPVKGGEQVTVNVDIVTGATVQTVAMFYP